MRADHRPIPLNMREREEPERDGRQQPAHGRNADRRDLAANGAADDVVAGPEQRGKRQQQIGIVVNPAVFGRHFVFFTGHRRVSQQSTAARTAAAAAKPISAILPSTMWSGKTCSTSGASRIAAPPPITAAYQGISIQVAAIPATTEPAVTIIEVHNTAGPEPCATAESREALGKCPLEERICRDASNVKVTNMTSGTILASDMFFSHPAGRLDPKKAISVTYETYISGTCNRRGEEKSRSPDVERGCRSQAGCKSSRKEA